MFHDVPKRFPHLRFVDCCFSLLGYTPFDSAELACGSLAVQHDTRTTYSFYFQTVCSLPATGSLPFFIFFFHLVRSEVASRIITWWHDSGVVWVRRSHWSAIQGFGQVCELATDGRALCKCAMGTCGTDGNCAVNPFDPFNQAPLRLSAVLPLIPTRSHSLESLDGRTLYKVNVWIDYSWLYMIIFILLCI